MRTKVFSYRGVVGAETDLNHGEFINDPLAEGQLGCLVAATNVDITKEAKDLIRKAPRESGSFSAVMLFRQDDTGAGILGLLGYGKHIFDEEDLRLSRDCDTSVLEGMNEVVMEAPKDFKTFVDRIRSKSIRCPGCDAACAGTTDMTSFEPGDYTMCMTCKAILEIEPELFLRALTADEVDALPSECREQIAQAVQLEFDADQKDPVL